MNLLLGSNSIYELASKHQQLMMREINSTNEAQSLPRREEIDDTGSRSFLLQFDNLYPLLQQLLVKAKMNNIGEQELISIDAYVIEKIDEYGKTEELQGVIDSVDYNERATKTYFNELIKNVNKYSSNIFIRIYLLKGIYGGFADLSKDGVNLRETIGDEIVELARDIQKIQMEETEDESSYSALKKIDNTIASLVASLYTQTANLYNILKSNSNYVNWANEIERSIWEAFLKDFNSFYSTLIDVSKYSAVKPYSNMVNKILEIYWKISNLVDDMKRLRH